MAATLGKGVVNPEVVAGSQVLVLAALVGAIGWNLITWYAGIPSSSSHALIGGLIGAAVAHAGFNSLNGPSIGEKILLPGAFAPGRFSGRFSYDESHHPSFLARQPA